MLRKLSALLLPVAVGLLIFAATLADHLPDSYGPMSAAMGTSISIALTLLDRFHSQRAERAIESQLRDRRLAPGRARMSRRAGKARAVRSAHAAIDRLMRESSLLTTMGDIYRKVPLPDRPQFQDDFGALHCNAAGSAGGLRRMVANAEHLDDRTRDDILAAIGPLGDAPPADDGKGTIDTTQYKAISELLRPVRDRLRSRLDLAAAQPAGTSGGLDLRLDRDAYPPGAPIRATVDAGGVFLDDKVAITILDEGLGEAAKKAEVVPAKAPGQLPPSALAVCVNTVPGGLDAGQEYIARAECGSLHGEAAFAVENVAPTMRADRPTCAVGGYMDITVEDPAAAAGAAGTGISGAAGGRRLVVESPYDRIDVASRLREEDRPAGIFRVRVGCAGARGCEDAENAAVACRPNQLIRIKYESPAGTAHAAVLVEGNGASSTAGGPGGPSPGSGGGSGGTGRPVAGESGSGGDDDNTATEPPRTPASCCQGGGGDDDNTATEPRGRKGDEAGRMQGVPEGERGLGQ